MAIKEKEELKRLQTLLVKQKSDIEIIEKEKVILEERLDVAKKGLEKINKEISSIKKNSKLILSEHAMLRYLERSLKIDLKDIEAEIITDNLRTQYKMLGNGIKFAFTVRQQVFRHDTIKFIIDKITENSEQMKGNLWKENH